MKKMICRAFVYGVLLLFLVSACSSIQTLSNGKKIDTQLVGTWEGSETGVQMEDTKKEWRTIRYYDGTFEMHVKTITDGEVDELTEKGIWWVNGNLFFEEYNFSNHTNYYKYTFLDKQRVQFKMLNSSVNFNDNEYVIIDTKVAETKTKKNEKEGLSFEYAIKVNSVDEQYKYARENCLGCRYKDQANYRQKGIIFEALKFQKPNDEEVIYYFDVSSFYGN
jgi:hypothetical protein